MSSENPLWRRLQVSGVLLILGLLTEAVCLFWARPLSFLAFISVGGAFLLLGVIVYLLSLLSTKRTFESGDS
jgi:hypothetical protein